MTEGAIGDFNLLLEPEIQMLPPQHFGLMLGPRIGMSPSTTGEAEFNFSLEPSIGMNQVPDTAFNVHIESPIGINMGASMREHGAMQLEVNPLIGMTGSFVMGPPAYDNSATSAYQNGITSGTPFTWSQSCAASPYAIVALFLDGGTSHIDPSGTFAVSFGGTSLTSLGSISAGVTGTSFGSIVVYAGATSVSAGSKTVSVTATETGDKFYGYGMSTTFENITSVGTLQTAKGDTRSPAVSVPSASGDVVWGAILCAADTSVSSFSLSQRQAEFTATPTFVAGDTAGASTVPVSATITTDRWAAVGLSLA